MQLNYVCDSHSTLIYDQSKSKSKIKVKNPARSKGQALEKQALNLKTVN